MSFEEEVESYSDFPEVPLFQETRRFSEIGFQRKMHISLIILFIVHGVYVVQVALSVEFYCITSKRISNNFSSKLFFLRKKKKKKMFLHYCRHCILWYCDNVYILLQQRLSWNQSRFLWSIKLNFTYYTIITIIILLLHY